MTTTRDLLGPVAEGLQVVETFVGRLSAGMIPGALFRGHADKTWLPVPHAFRPNVLGIVERRQLSHWRQLATRFAKSTGDIEMLVLAQHFGIPTPLLDWSSNPLLALYFACEDAEGDVPGCVLQAPREQFQFFEYLSTVGTFRNDLDRIGLIDAGSLNDRASAQDSWMTLHPTSRPTPADYRVIFEIEDHQKIPVKMALAVFGLSEARVFSDLNLAAKAMKDWLAVSSILDTLVKR